MALSRFGLTNQWAPLCPHRPRSLVSPGRWKTVVEQLARWARFSYLPIGASLFKHSMVRTVIKKKDGQSTEQERGEKRRKES